MAEDIFENMPEYTAVENIIRQFDFDIVRSYMVIHKWKIVGGRVFMNHDHIDFDMHIPDIDELKNIARRILEDAMKSDNNPTFVSTAGFTAFKWGDELSLHFSIENITTELRYD